MTVVSVICIITWLKLDSLREFAAASAVKHASTIIRIN